MRPFSELVSTQGKAVTLSETPIMKNFMSVILNLILVSGAYLDPLEPLKDQKQNPVNNAI